MWVHAWVCVWESSYKWRPFKRKYWIEISQWMHIRLETSAIGITNFTKYFASSRQENEQECVREARKELANKGDTTGEKLDRYIDWTLLSLNCCSSDKRNNARERKKKQLLFSRVYEFIEYLRRNSNSFDLLYSDRRQLFSPFICRCWWTKNVIFRFENVNKIQCL